MKPRRVHSLAVFDVGLVAATGPFPGGHVDDNGFFVLPVGFDLAKPDSSNS